MRRLTLGLGLALTLAASLTAGPTLAEPGAEDRAAIRGVIEGQIDAFGRDDAAAAYGFAAGGIQKMFGSPETFLDMVKRAYAPVYRPKTRVFGPIADGAAGPEQDLLITDSSGVDWIARYTLERQPDGGWRISGCRLIRNEGGSA